MKNDMSYKGHIIRFGLIGDVFVGKNGNFFYCCRSIEEAKKAIDSLV